jgi:hypothetical protein
LFVGFADHPKWRRVARDAETTVANVIATVAKLLETANAGQPRGSVADFSPEEWSLSLGVEREVIDRIWHALVAVGWIDREYITKWDTWQPDKEDPTHRDRQARYRAKKIAERQRGDAVTRVTVTAAKAQPAAAQIFHAGWDGASTSRDTVTSVTVPPRAEQKTKEVAEGRDQVREALAAAFDWLYGRSNDGEGLFAVMHGCSRGSELYARNLIRRWLAELDDDAETLARIVRAVDGNASGRAYEQLVQQLVAGARDEGAGVPRLPLPPRSIG